jgi:hypothetical protein
LLAPLTPQQLAAFRELFYAIKESATVNLANKIVMRPLASLAPYASNPRTHTPAQIDLIARSIEAFGFTNPLLVDGERGIIAGHGRYQAAQKLRLAEVPTIELRRPNGHAGQSRSIASTKPTASSPRSTSTVRERLMRRIARTADATTTRGIPETDE